MSTTTHAVLAPEAGTPTTPSTEPQSSEPQAPRPEIAPGVTASTPLPPVLEIVPWSDPSFEFSGHDPRSAYVERFWLGLLGPPAKIATPEGTRSA